jgi:predicted amidohydrolase
MSSQKPLETVRVAALQMTSAADVDANLLTAGKLLEEAAAAGARIAVLPENFSFMGRHDADKRAVAERDGSGPVQDFLSARARDLKLWIVAGTTPISDIPGERVAAASLVYDDAGRRAGRYDKIHLFDVDIPGKEERYRESGNIAPGTRMQLVPTPAGLLGLSVCYDMRFPELYRPMAAAGAQWFTVPAAFTVPTGRAHWETLLRARAIENLSFVVAPAQWGQHASGRETYGDSIIIDHWGTVLGRLRTGQGIVVADLDLEAQRTVRRDFPALSHRVM